MELKDQLEPGVLSTFRLFTYIRLGMQAAISIGHIFLIGQMQPARLHLSLFMLVEPALLLLYLSIPALQRILRSFYLPVAILWATVGPTLQQQADFWLRATNQPETYLMYAAWLVIPFLFIPLAVVSWQYSYRAVSLFCIFTALLDLLPWLMLGVEGSISANSYPIFGILAARTISLLFVGKLIHAMMTAQRKQRVDLLDANRRLTLYTATLEQLTLSRQRNQLAREMQDLLAHTLSGVAVELEAVRTLWDQDPQQAQSMLVRSLHDTREGLSDARRTLHALQATPLDDLGLELALHSMVEAIALRTGARLELSVHQDVEQLPLEIKSSVYQTVQAALTDLTGNFKIRLAHITLTQAPKHITLQISAAAEPGQALALQAAGLPHLFEAGQQTERNGGSFKVEQKANHSCLISYQFWIGKNSSVPSVWAVSDSPEK